jgi:hypothetical protein
MDEIFPRFMNIGFLQKQARPIGGKRDAKMLEPPGQRDWRK